MEETLRSLVALGFAMLLVLLRADARRFGVADARDPALAVTRPVARRRLAWYGLALGLTATLVLAHPDPRGVLGLGVGETDATLTFGALLVVLAVVQTLLVARLRGLPLAIARERADGWAIGDGVVTALVDEVAFRGAVLGLLVLAGTPPLLALLGQTALYALATGTAAPGGDRYRLALAIGVGVVGGLATLASGGIGASLLGHAVARVAISLVLEPAPSGQARTPSALVRARP